MKLFAALLAFGADVAEAVDCPNDLWTETGDKCVPTGVVVECTATDMTVTFKPGHLYVALDDSHLSQATSAATAGTCEAVTAVTDNAGTADDTSDDTTEYTVTIGLDACGTTVTQSGGTITFSNSIQGSTDALRVDNIITTQALTLQVSCVFDETFNISVDDIGVKAGTHDLDGSSSTGNFETVFTLNSYVDAEFETVSSTSNQVIIGNPIYNKVTAESTFPSNLEFVVTGCAAQSGDDAEAEGFVKYTVLEDGCLDTLINTATTSLKGDASTDVSFSFHGFTFESTSDTLFLECAIQICATDTDGNFVDETCGYDFGGDDCATLKTELNSSLGFTKATDVFTYSTVEDAAAGAEDPTVSPSTAFQA